MITGNDNKMKYTSLPIIPMPKYVVGESDGGAFEYVSVKSAISVGSSLFSSAASTFTDLADKLYSVGFCGGNGGISLVPDETLGESEYTIEITADSFRGVAANRGSFGAI